MLNNIENITLENFADNRSRENRSAFITGKIAALCDHFLIEYARDNNRIEYFITDKADKKEISFSLVFCRNIFAHQLHVSKFYPGLFRQPSCKYLSAAAFFLMVHHCGDVLKLTEDYTVFLQCRRQVYDNFYAKLDDFSLKISREGQGENVDVVSSYLPVKFDTAMIKLRQTISE